MNKEIWKTIPSQPKYEVSNLGRVNHIRTGRLRMFQKCKSGKGYYGFNTRWNGINKIFYVHSCVAEAFIGVREKGMVVDHIDRDIFNNHLSNLRYCTPKENSRNSDRMHNIINNGKLIGSKGRKGYSASLRVGNKKIHIGVFKNKIDSHNAYMDVLRNGISSINKYRERIFV